MRNNQYSTETQQSAEIAQKFLITRILEQAARDKVSLADAEKTMLRFAEPIATSEIEAAAEVFDRTCDSNEYEAKIARLIRRAYERDIKTDERSWRDAIAALRIMDCYLLVMVDQSGIVTAEQSRIQAPEKWNFLVPLFNKANVPLAVVGLGGFAFLFTPLSKPFLYSDIQRGVSYIVWIALLWASGEFARRNK
jgi:hypothetical protein